MELLPRGWRLRRAARRHFGWDSLRAGQLGAMKALLRRRDAVVVLATGAGKSAIYQVPGMVMGRVTVVVCPLLALQQDQIAGLNGRGDPGLAVRISSAQTPRQNESALRELREGRARFLFITPEQLADPARLGEVRSLQPGLVAVDEAHCVSSWGYDFRPDYLHLGHMIVDLGRPPVVALTATASPPVREDIATVLGMRDPFVVVAGLDRPNLRLAAVRCTSEEGRRRALLERIAAQPSPGIVYAPTRAASEDLAQRLRAAGIAATAFHAGLPTRERDRRHADFMADQIPVMVATSAFGMGVDKPGIRWVFHAALPDSPDSYVQEIGRAGRDGADASTVLFFRSEDVALQRFFAGGAPAHAELMELAAAIRHGAQADGTPLTRTALARTTGLPARRLTHLLTLLERTGAVGITAGGRLTVPRHAPPPAEAADIALREVARQQTLRRSRTDMMRQYAETSGCRGRALLGYFGEAMNGTCGHCDNCADGPSHPHARTHAKQRQPFPVRTVVRHAEWGAGTVMAYERDRMVVLFHEAGYKTLSVPIVRKRALLTAEQPTQ